MADSLNHFRPEWRLIKALKFAGSPVPTAVAMREFDKVPAWTIEPGKRFGAAFDGARFGASRTPGRKVAGQGAEQILPELSFQPVRSGLRYMSAHK